MANQPGRLQHTLPLVIALIALAGCIQEPTGTGHGHMAGDHHHGDDDTTDTGNLQLTGAEDILINVTGSQPSEFRFTPDRIQVQSGQRVGINFTNAGAMPHEFSINDLQFHLHVNAGETASAAFIAPEPGEYDIGCYLPGHYESGMKGLLIVT